MAESGLLEKLIQAFCCLPGVGPKSAQRMAFHLLQRDRGGAGHLARTLQSAVAEIGQCSECRTLTELPVCRTCQDSARDRTVLCIVESPADVYAVVQATVFKGLFFVLHGHISPLDGVGPEELGLKQLDARLATGEVEELILATGTTVEGEATAHYINDLARRHSVRATRIAQGVPLGGELEYIDSGTILHAFTGRKEFLG